MWITILTCIIPNNPGLPGMVIFGFQTFMKLPALQAYQKWMVNLANMVSLRSQHFVAIGVFPMSFESCNIPKSPNAYYAGDPGY
jgi:hypothetical protein